MYTDLYRGITFDGNTHLVTWQRAIPVATANGNKPFGWKTCVVEKRWGLHDKWGPIDARSSAVEISLSFIICRWSNWYARDAAIDKRGKKFLLDWYAKIRPFQFVQVGWGCYRAAPSRRIAIDGFYNGDLIGWISVFNAIFFLSHFFLVQNEMCQFPWDCVFSSVMLE